MSDWLLPEQGARPWLPAPGVTERLVLHEYDIPLAGLLEQHGSVYLYSCLLGEVEALNVWAYVLVSDEEAERIAALQGDDVVTGVAAAVTSLPATVALARDHELRYWLHMPAYFDKSPLRLAGRFVEQLLPVVEAVWRDTEELTRRAAEPGR